MCGRFTLRDPVKAYRAFLRREAAGLPGARFNIAPGQNIPVIRREESGERTCEELLWGLIPGWSSAGEGKPTGIINARSETVSTKPAFRAPFRHRRCLVPADGFYEWRTRDGRKQPYFFRLRGDRPFAFAALWDEWQPQSDSLVQSFCLLTTNANAVLAPIHDRMPVILDEEGAERWLGAASGGTNEKLAPLMRPYRPEEMESMPVSTRVNRTSEDGPACLDPPDGHEPEQLHLL